MNKLLNNHSLLICIAIILLQSCKTNIKPTEVSQGNANFTTYIAIGNSLTSGYADGALSYEGQKNSYPAMLAQQFQQVGGGDFIIPYLPELGGGNNGADIPRRILGYTSSCASSSPVLSPILDPNGATVLTNVSASGPYNLIGVPGAKAIDANNILTGVFNPFLKRFCQTPGQSTMLTEALRKKATFYSLWLGNNDVLLYATAGALDQPVFPATLSDTAAVRDSLTSIVNALSLTGAKGVIANIPDVTSIPYFTTIPWNSVVLRKGQADTLNKLYADVGLSAITWSEGANGLLIVDSSINQIYMRHATAQDYILLSTPGDSLKCAQWGVNPAKPLRDAYVLDASETEVINNYTAHYNQSIAEIAQKYNLALVDIHGYLKQVVSGIQFNGVTMNASFISGGLFSLDGVHPNQRGYALIANEFIKSINAKFGSTIPYVDPYKYKGIVFP